jgi:anti-anti-sigma factor
MESATDEGLVLRDGAGDRSVGVSDQRAATADHEARAGTRVEPTPTAFAVRRVDHPLGVVLTLGGELDLASVPLLQEQLDRAMRGRAAVVIDLSGLRFIDSCGLRTLVGAERQLHGSGGRLVLVRGPRAVHRLFELTRLDSHFEFCESPSAALRAAREPRIGSRRIPKPDANRQTAAELRPASEE